MGLDKYHQKRHFNDTPEPKGTVCNNDTRLFVVQKHAASHLHYDFRIQLEGVLKSWAIPKGPTLDPTVKRLSIHVEDHPIEYGTFEGIIPKGEYGGGTVLLWDKGVWEPLDKNPVQAYYKGHIRFLLFAEKLNGRWDLIQFKSEENHNSHWFLVKFKDDYARSLKLYDVTKTYPNSVISGKSLAEIAESDTAVWTNKQLDTPLKKNLKEKQKFKPQALQLPSSPFPDFIKPQLATLVDKAPEGEDWGHEIKFDGYRILAFKNGKNIKLLSRNQKDWTHRFKIIADELKKIPLAQFVLDGEVVVLDKKNRPSFQLLQDSVKNEKTERFIYYIFDILYYHQWDVRDLPFIDRKNLLPPLLQHTSPQIRYSDYVIGQSKEFYERSCQFALEGIISKKLVGTYESKRSKSWLKIKCNKRQEFVIAGFTSPTGSRSFFGSLVLGAYNAQGKFIFCGKVGTGFTDSTLKKIHSKLEALTTDEHPFDSKPPDVKSTKWVQPKLVAEIEFTEWTDQGRLRHPVFKGLRTDKHAEEVYKELEEPIEKVTAPKQEKSKAVKLTSLKKMMYPEDKISKGDIYNYYSAVASFILPFIQNRLLTLVRCPSHYQECFYQKHWNQSTANTLLSFPIKNKEKKTENYLYLTDQNGLFGLVQMGVLEIHPWGSTINHIELPDMIVFDLDPSPELLWEKTVQAAMEIKQFLEALDLRSFIKNTGGKGLHVVVPIEPKYDWDVIKRFSELFVKFVEKQNPENYITNMSKSKRKGKIYLDYLRNQRNATAISAYSTRARAGAPIATPLHWDELTNNIKDTFYTIHTLPERLSNLKKDPWEDFWDLKQELKF